MNTRPHLDPAKCVAVLVVVSIMALLCLMLAVAVSR